MTPKVSICIPNLNTVAFLPERFRTVFEQSFGDWELLVYDSYSDDGAWEYICKLAAGEPRMRAWQGPRQGTPGSWTPCVREASGEYVYVATSDDTMPPDCLATLVAALDRHPGCDLAHCALRAVDEHGRDDHGTMNWWTQGSIFALSSGPLFHRTHVRHAPFDGLLHLEGGSVYTSITQLLIRRSLFDRIGFFESTWGSVGDFNWSMRAGLVANTVHVPDTWGGWRVHSRQATAQVPFGSDEHASKIDNMIDHAIGSCGHLLPPAIREPLESRWSPEAKALRAFAREAGAFGHLSPVRRKAFVARRALAGSMPARRYVTSRLFRRSFADWVQRCLGQAGYGPMLVPRACTPTERAFAGR